MCSLTIILLECKVFEIVIIEKKKNLKLVLITFWKTDITFH